MNAFANWLFTLLLGWTGGLANRAWNAVVNSAGGISDFFSRYWLLPVLVLIIGGTVLDYGVWFVRWRPYLVWRSWITRRRRDRSLRKAERDLNGDYSDQHTRETLADWASTPEESYPVYDLGEQPAEQPFRFTRAPQGPYFAQEQVQDAAYPQQPQAYGYEQPPSHEYEQQPQYQEPGAESPQDDAIYMPQQTAEQEDASYASQPYRAPQADGYGFPYARQPEDPASRGPEPARRRRSDRRQRTVIDRLSDLRDRIGGSENEGMLDGLPAPVRHQEAFHDPVYPRGYPRQQNGAQPPRQDPYHNGQERQ